MNGVKRRRKIDCNDRVPFFDREILDIGDVLNAGIVHQDIERTEFFFGGADHEASLTKPCIKVLIM